ncbi:hypothetical protein [Nonomuraea sediminis]|uniref:hypothetical protein n=1 Tax=Nonomuraea sediminis TaxID=2835864 RepID=UPI001BDC0A6A|nr:hypothetical protein [Nonomuraea sediminis]
MPVTKRLTEKIKQDFPEDSATICSMLHEVDNKVFDGNASERTLAAVIMIAQGSVDRFMGQSISWSLMARSTCCRWTSFRRLAI